MYIYINIYYNIYLLINYNFKFKVFSLLEVINCISPIYYQESINVYNFLLNSIDWIYSTIDSNLIYKFKIWYYIEFTINDNFYFIWLTIHNLLNYQLYFSTILDNMVNLGLLNNSFCNDWVRNFLILKSSNLIWMYHPELVWHNFNIYDFFLYNYSTNENINIFNSIVSELTILSCTLYIHILFLITLLSIFIIYLFSFYSNYSNEENFIDSDYLNNSVIVESEKEITSIDDYLLLLITLLYVFGFYFYIYSLFSLISQSVIFMIYYSLFISFIFILGIPTLLLYDLGIYFLVYLKGTGKSSNSLIEVVYDYIACVVFYTRIFAQWIRLILMFVTYISLSHYVAEFELTNNFIIFNDLKGSFNNYNNFKSNISYYILVILPFKFFYWIYELLHTLFLVTSQFVAFFAIVFWLILFLYTFFVIEKFEDFFKYKRANRIKYNNIYKKLNNI
uniref:Ymf66 n=1 Tax=Ichthyophthirius multifiliis TaxID=5932 RepID=G1FLA8_ICHMU|nr:Ymf66 [Ichthyophthirius multifiliis]AEL89250.1 Ymf66 [Ichthyophthirius multifiliis]